jgi:thiosulfate dehydrogenase
MLSAVITCLILLFFLSSKISMESYSPAKENAVGNKNDQNISWQVPDPMSIPRTPEGELTRYGRDLIIQTSHFLGPMGTVMTISNGMNCQNCHLDGGTRFFGNNYSGVYSTYPKFRERSGSIENIYKRVNDCIQRSLNGTMGLDTNSREMQAIASYIEWLGKEVPKGKRPEGAGIAELAFLSRPADPVKGKLVYLLSCQRCHGANGEGKIKPDSSGYEFPPLWGDHSYTTAAGLFRLSRFAGFVKFNMPFDAPHNAKQLTDEEAWDVAAFVNSQPRPVKTFKEDWPNIAGKPFDYPFGPYIDTFSEKQHKFGPFEDILMFRTRRTQ